MLCGVRLAWSCGDLLGPSRGPGIHFVRGANATGAILEVLDAPLVVEVRDADGNVAREGTVIRFESIITYPGRYPDPPLGEVMVPLADGSTFTVFTTRPADWRGRAEVRVMLGTRAPEARLVVSAPELGLVDTARFSVIPGPPESIALTPWDTTIVAGHSYTIHARVRDHYGNTTPDGVRWTVGGANGGSGASITSAGVVTVNAPGDYEFTARLIGGGDTPWAISSLTVVPPPAP
jgi:hypothetical protein